MRSTSATRTGKAELRRRLRRSVRARLGERFPVVAPRRRVGVSLMAAATALVLALAVARGGWAVMAVESPAASLSAPQPETASAFPAAPAQPNPPKTLPAEPNATLAPAVPPRFTVLLDAAHGGPEPGTLLAPRLKEKDLTLALSVWLRSNFAAHGMAVVTTRESDTPLTPERRAALANQAHPSACLLLHATASGTGVHLYTSALAPATAAPGSGELRPWATAQAPYITDSLKLSSELSESLARAGVPVLQGSVSVAPVDNMTCPAVLVELAPLVPRRGHPGAAIDDRAYQTRIVDALSAALGKWETDRSATR